MSFIRAEAQKTSLGRYQHYDLICETSADLTQAHQSSYIAYNGSKLRAAAGSLCYCIETGKVHVLGTNGTWQEVGA